MRAIHSLLALILLSAATYVTAAEPLKLLFLGDSGHHQPAARFAQLQPVLKERGIELTYSDKVEDLNAETLGKYDGLIIYANTTRISPEQEQALLDYVASGKGFIPLHCASYCFLNSPKYIELVGAQFQRHGTGTFRTILSEAEHPIMRGFGGFESWDETYVHTKHNENDRTVLEYRQEGDRREPWTWVRTHGKGRVFYTAWGHDQRTWGNPGFQNLVERGIRWAVGADPGVVPAFTAAVGQAADPVGRASGRPVTQSAFAAADPPAPPMTPKRTDVKPFEYVEAKIAYYPPGRRSTGDGTWNKMQLPLPPEESMKHFITPVGFEVKLFVAEPQLQGKPIYMTWDERGRLWVCETYDYPNELQFEGEGRDRIRICEDTDGDGRADKFTVFAEKLSIPTTIAFYRGGAIVQEGGRTIYLKDTNGDDKADLRKTLVTGWNMRDTHGEVSNFRYGLDNWYWAMQGYNDSQPVLTNGKTGPRFRQGFFRFKVEGENENVAVTELEFLRSTNNNTWGLGISEEGIIFGSTANGNPSEHMPIPNRYYEAVRGWSSTALNGIADSNRFYPVTENVRQVDWHGGFTAAAGHALYIARNYPREYWNRTAFVTEPTGHLVATFVLRQQRAGFKSKNSWNLVASDDEWTSPIQAEVGPDGNVWFIDWYNYIVQHNPTPSGFRTGKGAAYETDLRDKKHGRIYRLAYVGRASGRPEQASRSSSNDSNALVATLKSDNMQQRLLAQRLLVERGDKNVAPTLAEMATDQTVDSIGLNTTAIHSLNTLAGLSALDPALAIASLKHPSAGVRRSAVQLLPPTNESLSALLGSGALNDSEAQVRLQAILALTKFKPDSAAAKAVVQLLADSTIQNDRLLLDAVTSAAAAQEELFLTTIAASSEKSLTNQAATDRIAIIAEHVARGEIANPRPLVAALLQAPEEIAAAIVRGLAKGWPRDHKPQLTPELEQSIAALFDKLPFASKAQVATLATRWGSTKLGEQITAMAGKFYDDAAKSDLADDARATAAAQFVDLQKNESSAVKLLDLITPRTAPQLARGLVEALGRSESLAIGVALAEQLPKLTPAVRQSALKVLLSRNDWTNSLLSALQQGKLQLADLSLDQKQALANHPDRQTANRARRILDAGGSLPNPDRQKVLDEISPLVEQKGDAVAGKLVFKNQCAKCHTHFGEGTKIGPDLSGMAVHPKHELLVHLIDPSRSVEGNYRVYSVLTTEGQALSGLLASETKTSIELIDTEAKRHVVLREDIEALQASTKSLMPEGFEKQVKPEEIRDLLEFLTQRGQYVPIPLDKVATAVSTRGMFYDESSTQERLTFSDWSPKTFDGVPFVLVDPQDGKKTNAILLYGPEGKIPPSMPRTVLLPCNFPAKAVHLLSGVAGWAYPYGGDAAKGSLSMIVRLHYADGQTEDHKLLNGDHFADYIRRVDVPHSKFAFDLRGRQIRYLSVPVERTEPLAKIELVKGDNRTAPVVMAVTVETR